jgi:hypothetical protein
MILDALPADVASKPFAEKNLNRIFRIDSEHKDRVSSRESSWLEFKQSFNWAGWEKYARTAAAFANAKGGYIVFGIGNKPRKLLGMANNNFTEVDPETITKDLDASFAPALHWESYVYEFRGRRYGLLFFWESLGKPVIATANRKEFKEGDILFRYRAKTERIRYAELQGIIEARQTKNQDAWLRVIQKTAKIGADNAAVLDLIDGTLSGPGGTLVIDEQLLHKIRFIREGRFHERDGDPTLRVIGDVQQIASNIIQPTRLVNKQVGITTPDIVHAFLDQEAVSSPREFIRQICFEMSAYLPVYYFIHLARLLIADVVELIKDQQSRTQSKKRLLKRLSDDIVCIPHKHGNDRPAGRKVAEYRQQFLCQSIDTEIPAAELKYALRAVQTLTSVEVNRTRTYMFPLLKNWFDAHYASRDDGIADRLRRTICYLDCVLYAPAQNQKLS